jgi:hypothetical protein
LSKKNSPNLQSETPQKFSASKEELKEEGKQRI